MKKSPSLPLLWLITLATLMSLISCRDPYPGYGIILWSADEAKIASGTPVAVLAHSQLRKTVQVMRLDEHQKTTGDPVSVDNWRIQEFPNHRDMQTWAGANKDMLNLFARSLKLALPVRNDPLIADGNIIYRLRDGEDVKILSRQEKESDQGGLKGYWYEILTQTGTRGWVFSVQIQPWRMGDVASKAELAIDRQLEQLYAGNWRPEDFPDMIASGNYDLGYFKPETGFFVDRTRKTIHLATGKDVLDYAFNRIDKLDRNIWTVPGTSLQITFRDEKTLVVQYQKANNVMTRVFVNMEENIPELFKAETARRTTLLDKMAGASGVITSGSYGSITIGKDGHFTWEGADSLRPRIIPPTAENSGNISFDLFMAPELRENYRGVASFNFAGSEGIEQVNFLYQFKPDGIQMEFVPQSLIKGREVKKSDSNPTVLFFGY